MKLMLGNNIESLKQLPDNSVDSVVTDPPYGLSFMNKKWDYDVPSVQFWKEVYRVLKPGGHILSFGGTRTYHRMVVNIEDAGFEIRDQIMWLYGSGFPKSHNIGKAVDKFGGNNLLSTEIGTQLKEARTKRGLTLKAADELFCNGTSNYNWLEGRSDGQRIPNQELFDKIVVEWPELKDIRDKVLETEREILGTEITNKTVMSKIGEENESGEYVRTKGQSDWEGWGTALKPANEPICVARKPLSEKSVAENVLKWGTGGINVDGCRVGFDMSDKNPATNPLYRFQNKDKYKQVTDHGQREGENVAFTNSLNPPSTEGRFPANIILECICDNREGSESHENPNCPCYLLDEQSGVTISKGPLKYDLNESTNQNNQTKLTKNIKSGIHFTDKGGASRFFYQAKVSKAERNMGLDGFEVEHTNPNCPCYILDEQSGFLKGDSPNRKPRKEGHRQEYVGTDNNEIRNIVIEPTIFDSGGASRFFYQAKVSKAERNMGLDGFEEKEVSIQQPHNSKSLEERYEMKTKNNHPTVKPVNLMAYLCRLVTPQGGVVLDPFMGSGSTGIAARLEGFDFIGMEMDSDYMKIAESRIESFDKYKKFHNKNTDLKNGNTRMASRSDNSNSIGLGICKNKKK
jgi:DNA modification methylase